MTVSAAPPAAEPVTVTIPAEIADTERLSPKSITVAIPIVDPSSLISADPPPADASPGIQLDPSHLRI